MHAFIHTCQFAFMLSCYHAILHFFCTRILLELITIYIIYSVCSPTLKASRQISRQADAPTYWGSEMDSVYAIDPVKMFDSVFGWAYFESTSTHEIFTARYAPGLSWISPWNDYWKWLLGRSSKEPLYRIIYIYNNKSWLQPTYWNYTLWEIHV